MNEITKAIVAHNYGTKHLRKQLHIFKRTKKTRIKDKAFNKLFYAFMDDKPVRVMGQVVLVSDYLYTVELKKFIEK